MRRVAAGLCHGIRPGAAARASRSGRIEVQNALHVHSAKVMYFGGMAQR